MGLAPGASVKLPLWDEVEVAGFPQGPYSLGNPWAGPDIASEVFLHQHPTSGALKAWNHSIAKSS